MIAAPETNNVSPSAKKQKIAPHSNRDEGGLLCKRLSENAKLPTRATAEAAGYDLYR